MSLTRMMVSLAYVGIALNVLAVPPLANGKVAPVPAEELHVRKGAGNFIAKLDAGKPVTVAYLGGSITAMEGWRNMTTDWLRRTWPKAKVTEVHAAIGGTGSGLGVFRLGHDALSQNPDLLFVEFATNDDGVPAEAIWRNFDGIVQQTWSKNPETDIVFAYTITSPMMRNYGAGKMNDAASAMEHLADHYGIPSVCFGPRVAAEVKAGRLVMRLGEVPTAVPMETPDRDRLIGEELKKRGQVLFAKDGVHPALPGHGFYLKSVVAAFEAMRALPPADHAAFLGKPFFDGKYAAAKMVPVAPWMTRGAGWTKLAPDEPEQKSFSRRGGQFYRADRPGARLRFRFCGTKCCVYDLLAPKGANIRVTVDGKVTRASCPRFDSYCWYTRLGEFSIYEGAGGEHSVELEVLEEQPDRAQVKREDTKTPKYDGTWFQPCQIMVVGDVVLSESPRLGDVRLEGAVAKKMAALFSERVFGAEARGKIYDETVEAFRTHYDDVHPSYGWSGSKSLPEGLWQGEYWGKTMLSSAVVGEMLRDEALLRDLKDRAERFVREFQRADGYLSSYANADFVGGPTTNGVEIFCWNVWGQKYTMWALLELARATSSSELLAAARRMADGLIARLDRLGVGIEETGYFVGLPSMSVLKPMLLLYEQTKDERYRAFARKIVRQWDRADGKAPNLVANAFCGKPYHAWYPNPGRWAKAYETMSCLEGLVAYAVLERDDRVLSAVRQIVGKLGTHELNAVGGVGFFDHFTNAAACPNATTEPCDVTHWIRVNRELFLATDDVRCVDALEFAFYNAFLAGVYRDGKWGAHSVRSHGTRHRTAPHQVGMKYHQCCIDNMPRTFVDFASTMLTRTPDGTLSVNLYSPGSAKLKGDEIAIVGEYPVENRVRVTVKKAKPGKVRFRRPACFDAVRVDGAEQPGAWHEVLAGAGEKTYELEFVRTPRLVASKAHPGSDPRADAFETVNENPEMKGLARTTPAYRLVYGPLLLAKSRRLGERRDEILSAGLTGGTPCACTLTPVANADVWGEWRAEIRQGEKDVSVKVCDFASAADSDDPTNAFSIWF